MGGPNKRSKLARRSSHRSRRGLVGIIALAGVVVTLAAVPFVDLSVRDHLQTLTWPHSFSPQAWREHPAQRYYMAVDLAGSGDLAGKSRRWLRQNLGAPVAAGGSDAGGVLVWPVPSPQRPDDVLIVQLRRGVAVNWGVTSDPFTVVG